MGTGASSIGLSNSFLGLDCVEHWRSLEPRSKRSLDVVLLTHPRDERDMPRLFPWSAPLPDADRRVLARHLRPLFGEIIPTPHFTAGYLFMVCFGDEMMNPRTRGRCRDVLQDGLRHAAREGARTVCLGGLTGSLSGYGRKVQGLASELGLALTTGHSVTALVVMRTYLKALEELHRDPTDESLCLLGLGSVGGALLRLLAHHGLLPQTLTIVERPIRADHVRTFAKQIRAHHPVQIEIELTDTSGHLDADTACYRSSSVVSAVSTPNVINPLLVAPGAVLVDDSQPHCWSRAQAWARCRERLDLVPCEAGLVDCSSLGFHSRFPFDFAAAGAAGSPIAWCCLTEGLLRAVDPSLPVTLGEPTMENLLRYEEAFDRAGLSVASLQCGPNFLPMAALAARPSRSGALAKRIAFSEEALRP